MMDYDKTAEIVKREVEAKLQKKRKRIIAIKRVSFTVSSLCAAIIIGIGVWNKDNIRKNLRNDYITQPTENVEINPNVQQNDAVVSTTTTVDIYNHQSDYSNTNTTISSQIVTTSNNSRSSSTKIKNDIQSKQSTAPVATTVASATNPSFNVTTATIYTPPAIVTATINPPPDRTTASTSENETTTTTIDHNSYAFSISFVDDVNLEKIVAVDAKLIQQQIEWIDEEHSRDVGESSVVAEWNSSDSTPYTTSFLKQAGVEYRYIVVVDELPEGYSFYGKSSVEFNISGVLEDVKIIEILLTKGKTVTNTLPLSGTYSLKLKVLDIATNKNVPNLDCELFNIQSDEVVATWNTSETEEIYVKNLKYEFDKPNSYNGNITYAIRINNLPDNYRFFYGKTRDKYGICGFGLEEFENGTNLNCIAYLENTDIYLAE